MTTARARRAMRSGGVAGVEALEPRTLMAAAVADHFPLVSGSTWDYEGTVVEDDLDPVDVTARASANDETVGGEAFTSLRLSVAYPEDPDGELQGLDRLLRRTEEGLVLGLERTSDLLGAFTRTPASAVVLIPALMSGGTSMSFSVGAVVTDDSYGDEFEATLSGSVRIDGPQAYSTALGSLNVYKVTRSGSLQEADGQTTSETEVWYLAPGIGIVGLSYSQSVQIFDTDISSRTIELGISGSSLLAGLGLAAVKYEDRMLERGGLPDGTKGTAFGSRDINGEVVVRTFTITNTGGAALSLRPNAAGLRVWLMGANPRQYRIMEQPAAVVEPGTSTTFTICFDPSATGTKFARFQMRTDAPAVGVFQSIMRGTGVLKGTLDLSGRPGPAKAWLPIVHADASPALIDGTRFVARPAAGEATSVRNFRLANVGPGTLTFGSTRVEITGVAASDFSVVIQPLETLEAGRTATLRIAFNPTAVGLRQAVVTILSDDRQRPQYSFGIAGLGQ